MGMAASRLTVASVSHVVTSGKRPSVIPNIKRRFVMLRFNDGMEFDVSGPMRLSHRSDGWYVVGRGRLIPVDSPDEGNKIIEKYSSGKDKEKGS